MSIRVFIEQGLNRFENSHNVQDILVPLAGFSFTVGGLLDFIQAGLAIILTVLTIVLMRLRISKLRREK